MQNTSLTRLVEWDLIPINVKYKPSLFDHLGEKALLILFFSFEDEKEMNSALTKAKEICLENPQLNVIGIHIKREHSLLDKMLIEEQCSLHNLNFAVYFDHTNATAAKYKMTKYPYWILSDKGGNIITSQEGSSFKVINLIKNSILQSTLLH